METIQKSIHFELPHLPYDFDALEPYIDSETMRIHHDKHHAGYVNKLNSAMEKENKDDKNIEEILKNISSYSTAVRNNGGGHYNHSLFWEILSHDGGGQPGGELAEAIEIDFGSFEEFKKQFEAAATGRFGSGWAWLIIQREKLAITSTANQDNPIMDTEETRGIPILGLDVWEHAYYLKYQNKRADYVSAFWNVVNWKEVEKRYKAAKENPL